MRLTFIVIIVLINLGMMHISYDNEHKSPAQNVLGTELESCCLEPLTGWYRDGYCDTEHRDYGVHVVCAIVTDEFLNFSANCGNDLKTARGTFPGLKAGDKWCLCVSRWKEAMEKGLAPPVVLESTHEKTLETVTLEQLKAYSLSLIHI